jgi:hypothetical protein
MHQEIQSQNLDKSLTRLESSQMARWSLLILRKQQLGE